MATWRPQRKVAAAGTVGPVVTALLAWALPSMPAPLLAIVASLVTAAVAYLVRGRSVVSTDPPIPVPPQSSRDA